MYAELVYETGGTVNVPKPMGTPRPDQMEGSEAEKLIEVCGRCCYDSMGTGRASFTQTCPMCKGRVDVTLPPHQGFPVYTEALPGKPEDGPNAIFKPHPPHRAQGVGKCLTCRGKGVVEGYHEHLLNVKHYSVHEHTHWTIEIAWPDIREIGLLFCGIPDIVVRPARNGTTRLTFNLRHVLEWPMNVVSGFHGAGVVERMGWTLTEAAREKVPHIFPADRDPGNDKPYSYKHVEPEHPREIFVSMFLEDSRVFSHEMVRHRGNMSQRSGRFVDETDRPMCIHPMLRDFLAENPEAPTLLDEFRTKWGIEKGMDSTTARKQAHSAARYYLGNGLSTEGIWTLSLPHWSHIFNMRLPGSADAAIRELMEQVVPIIKAGRYGHVLNI